MSRPRNTTPKYRFHAPTNRGVVDVYRIDGTRTTISLPGPFNSEESLAEFRRVRNFIEEHGGRLPLAKSTAAAMGDLTVGELVLQFLDKKVAVDYVDETGKPTTEQSCYHLVMKPIVRLFGSHLAREFDSGALEQVRQSMVDGSWMNEAERALHLKRNQPIGWTRRSINKQISRVRAMFKWATLKKLVPPSAVLDFKSLPPLKRGRGGARESDPVEAVPLTDVEKTLPKLPPVVADMVKLQLLLGCRPGELCSMKGAGLDRSGTVWIYTPKKHKTEHHGYRRTIAIGPQSQFILRRYLKDDLNAYLFSPAEQDQLIKAAKRASRKTKVQPSQIDRSKPDTERKPGERFTTRAYNRAIKRGAAKANVAPWHAHRLRHTAALLISREHGAEAARAVLGHRTISMTAHYAGVDVEKAADVARKMG
jgi:integrase